VTNVLSQNFLRLKICFDFICYFETKNYLCAVNQQQTSIKSMNHSTINETMSSKSFKFTTYNHVRDQRPAPSVDEGILVDIIRDNVNRNYSADIS
jgi:hypothetical protein